MNMFSPTREIFCRTQLSPSPEPREDFELELVALSFLELSAPIPSKLGGGDTRQVSVAHLGRTRLVSGESFETKPLPHRVRVEPRS